jgi:hypothetical protein
MPYVTIVLAAIQLVKDLLARGKKTGELTDSELAGLKAKADAIFSQYGQPAPKPPGV